MHTVVELLIYGHIKIWLHRRIYYFATGARSMILWSCKPNVALPVCINTILSYIKVNYMKVNYMKVNYMKVSYLNVC